jgi:thiol-disulfide isomerase/thioredoxin
MDSILKKPKIKYLARVNLLANLFNNSIENNDSNGAYNILFKMRLLHGKLLYRYNKIINSKKSTKKYFQISCLSSVTSLMNEKIVKTESVFNDYVVKHKIDTSTLKIIKSKSASKSSSKSSASSKDSMSGYTSESDNSKKILNIIGQDRQAQQRITSETSDSYGDLGDTLSDRFKKLKSIGQINYDLSKSTSNNLPLFNGHKSEETIKRENIKSEVGKDVPNFNIDIPSLLFFYNPGCPACVKTKPHWDTLTGDLRKKFDSINSKPFFNIMEINLAESSNNNLAELFQIQYIPTIIMMESSNKQKAKIEKIEGMADINKIKAFITESFAKFSA